MSNVQPNSLFKNITDFITIRNQCTAEVHTQIYSITDHSAHNVISSFHHNVVCLVCL